MIMEQLGRRLAQVLQEYQTDEGVVHLCNYVRMGGNFGGSQLQVLRSRDAKQHNLQWCEQLQTWYRDRS